MKKTLSKTLFALSILSAFTLCGGEELRSQERSEKPGEWRSLSSGKMQISAGEEKGEVRFDIDFGDAKSRWTSPGFSFREQKEKITGATGMEFDIKVNGNSSDVMYPLIYFYGKNMSIREGFRIPAGEGWQHVSITFKNLKNTKAVNTFNISLSSKTPKLSFSVKNIKFRFPEK